MNKKGFTLIELILTICILSIIAVISFVSVTNIIKSSKDKNCESIKIDIINATKDYVSDNRYSGDLELKMTIKAELLADQLYLNGNIKDPYSSGDDNKLDLEDVEIIIELNTDYTVDDITVNGLPNNCKKYG